MGRSLSALLAVVLVKRTTPSPAAPTGPPELPPLASRWTRCIARKPGIEPPCPAERAPSTFQTCHPRPCEPSHGCPGSSTTWCGSTISARVSRDRTSPTCPPRRAAHRERSPTVVQSLSRGGHGARVVLRLGEQYVGERVHREPLCRSAAGPQRRPGHAQRFEQARRARHRTTDARGPPRGGDRGRHTPCWSSGSGGRIGTGCRRQSRRGRPSRRPGCAPTTRRRSRPGRPRSG